MQLNPSPSYPVLQVQLYPPSVLVQLAFPSHSAEPSLHSSVSEEDTHKYKIICNYQNNIMLRSRSGRMLFCTMAVNGLNKINYEMCRETIHFPNNYGQPLLPHYFEIYRQIVKHFYSAILYIRSNLAALIGYSMHMCMYT